MKKIIITIIPLILSLGIVSVLPFVDADVGPDTQCRDEYVVVHRFQKNDYACLSIELAKSWEALKLGEIVNPEPIKQSSPPSQISEDSQTPSAKQLRCDTGLNLMINGKDGSTACVRPSSVQKLIESGWISIGSVPAQEPKKELETEQVSSDPKVTTQLDFLPDENDRAMYFVARFSAGLIKDTEVVKSNFFKFTPFKEYSSLLNQLHPENSLPKKPPFKFLLETLPSKDNIGYYQAIDDYFQIESSLFKGFDASIDVVTGDGTVLQTWEYTSCDLEDFSVYLQDNALFNRFTGESSPEIRERSIFHCGGYSLVAPEN
jgi:hypothetical protein